MGTEIRRRVLPPPPPHHAAAAEADEPPMAVLSQADTSARFQPRNPPTQPVRLMRFPRERGLPTVNRSAAVRRMQEINHALKVKKHTRAELAALEREMDEIENNCKAFDQAAALSGAADFYPSGPTKTKGISGPQWAPPSPLQATEAQWKSLFAASRSRVPGYSVNVGAKGAGLGTDWEIGLKTPLAGVGEGSPGSLLAPQMLPNAFPYRLEPDRVFSHFVGASANTQAVTWLQHVGNTGAAAVVAELEPKPQLGMQVEAKTTSFTTIAVLQTFSRQLADDFGSWMGFVPQALTTALIDAETDQIVNGTGNGEILGLVNTPGVLERSKGSDTRIDALVKAANDLRVGGAFATANLILMHPTTWTAIKTQKDNQGRYVLALNQPNDLGSVDNLFGTKVIVNTKVPEDIGIVMDTSIAVLAWTRLGLELTFNWQGDSEFRHNALTYRLEERIGIGVQYPKAICLVDGLEDVAGS